MPRRFPESGAVLLCLVSGCGRPAAGEPVDALAEAFAAAPAMAPRLSIATQFRRCAERVPAGGTIPRADCPAPPRAKPLRSFLPGIAPGADDPRSVHLLALHDLTAPDPRGIALENAISSLRRVAELADDPTDALVDLSAALILRAERTQAPRDLLEAYEIAQKAVDRAPRNPSALYNRALALDRFGLVEETAEDWKAAIAADSTSAWADEARRRLDSLRAIRAPVPPRDDAPLADYARYAAEEPQGARELGIDRLLAEWGDAIQRGDAARAEDRLRRAEALGTALLRRPGGDASLADLVRAIRAAAADSAATRKLAEAHREYGAARIAFDAADLDRSLVSFTTVEEIADPSPVLQLWTRAYLATVLVHTAERDRGLQLLAVTAEKADPRRHPALVARIRWTEGNMSARDERWERGLDHAGESAALFSRAGEREHLAAALSVTAPTRFLLGEPDSGYADVRRALGALQMYRRSLRLHNVLGSTADAMLQDGFVRAALRVQSEDVRVASRHSPASATEALLRRSQSFAELGELAKARADVSAARSFIAAVTESYDRAWLEADLHAAQAASLAGMDQQRQTAALDSAAAFFLRTRLPFRALPNLVRAAMTRIEAGDQPGAVTRLEEVVRILSVRRDSIGLEPRRAAVFAAARNVIDAIVTLKLARTDVSGALTYLDQARASLSGARWTSVRSPETRSGETALVYATVADTLLIWTVSGRTLSFTRMTLDTLDFRRRITKLEYDLERSAPEEELRPALSHLYDRLVRPVEEQLATGSSVVIIADGVLAGIPFAALYDHERHRYFVETHPIRFSPSLAGATRAQRASPPVRALFVADPSFDPDEHPLLDRLPHARAEIASVAAFYHASTLLEDERTSRDGLVRQLAAHTLLHFAGHAVVDNSRPEQSYLLLSAAPGKLTATEIARLDLRGLDLVILAACRTVGGSVSRSAGYTGLSGAFLMSGVKGTVATTWNIDDRLASMLLPRFHESYQQSRNALLALQAAQLAFLSSDDPYLRSPSAWGAFRYTGGM